MVNQEQIQSGTKIDAAAVAKKEYVCECPKHGNITSQLLSLNLENQTFLYCVPCLNEVLLKWQAKGYIQEVILKEYEPTKGTEVEDKVPGDDPSDFA